MDDLKMPSPRYLEKKKNEAKNRISVVFDEYKELLRDKTHPDNQTPAYQTKVKKTLQRLLTAADELDSVSPGEGIFGLVVLSLRSNLTLKDENTKLEKEIKDLQRKIRRLEKQKR
jgi:hypothetical protein